MYHVRENLEWNRDEEPEDLMGSLRCETGESSAILFEEGFESVDLKSKLRL